MIILLNSLMHCLYLKLVSVWGGYESLVNSPSKPDNKDDLRRQGIPTGLIRLSIGLEGAKSQITDLECAFNALN